MHLGTIFAATWVEFLIAVALLTVYGGPRKISIWMNWDYFGINSFTIYCKLTIFRFCSCKCSIILGKALITA